MKLGQPERVHIGKFADNFLCFVYIIYVCCAVKYLELIFCVFLCHELIWKWSTGGRHEPETVYFIKGNNKDGEHPWTCLICIIAWLTVCSFKWLFKWTNLYSDGVYRMWRKIAPFIELLIAPTLHRLTVAWLTVHTFKSLFKWINLFNEL